MAFLSFLQGEILSHLKLNLIILIAAVIFPLYGVILVVYRLFFSPLANVPGPKLAAATQCYETFYDLIAGGGGNFTRQIKKMHDKYGTSGSHPHHLRPFSQATKAKLYVSTRGKCTLTTRNISRPFMPLRLHTAS